MEGGRSGRGGRYGCWLIGRLIALEWGRGCLGREKAVRDGRKHYV